ncbi:hypothetical protein [Streptomyces flavofungini]|uniref:Lipoprotein n=1 Tax=Streptomyces flavofungini TaxID=68200 RepID=A0ABS0X2C5_9ACTN|nr:hypothetical protein [Streptomyces flavofungini]MBJ3807340.1 hypothetical protein [Streptomyces flavofungini]GHC66123.1 hypothetical protein GCM10010349_38460 [Streptomyces flavofungini]
MKPHPALPLLGGATAVLLATACGAPAEDRSDASPSTSAHHPDQRRQLVEWGKGDAEDGLRRAERALAYDDTPTDLVDTGVASFPDGLEKKFPTPGKRPYRLDITCAAPNTGDITLTLGRGDDEQEWTVPCNERQADQFNIPPGSTPFTARITPNKRQSENLAGIVWRLNTIAPDDVDECPDDISGCDER